MTVSVWMIVYNQELYIAEALDSVLMQKTDFDFEIVIGEDCSTDKTREILLEYQKKYPTKIKLLLHDRNQGMVKNQNLTFLACSGSYIVMLEGDDFWNCPDKLQRQYDTMCIYEKCDISFHPVVTTEKTVLNDYGKRPKIISAEEVIQGGGYFISTPSIMLKKSVLSKIPTFLNNAPAGDYYLQIFASLAGGALYIPDNMATYRVKSVGSWSASLENFNIKSTFTEKSLELSKKIDKYLNYEYTEAFQARYQKLALFLAIDYIHQKEEERFIEVLNGIRDYVKDRNFKYKCLYLLKGNPKLLLKVLKMYHSGKKILMK